MSDAIKVRDYTVWKLPEMAQKYTETFVTEVASSNRLHFISPNAIICIKY